MLSPHAWGCFSASTLVSSASVAFPTRVGVFLPIMLQHGLGDSFPHTRGGVSPSSRGVFTVDQLSPHAWGCF